MENILLPIDFSQSSRNAIFYALRLMQGKTCIFHILSIYEASNYTSGDLLASSSQDSIYDCLLEKNSDKMKKLIGSIKNSFPEEHFHFHAVNSYNVFTDAIKQLVGQHDIDLIVMGTDGISNISEKIFGSHTLRVIRTIDAPLLVIPNDKEFSPPRNLLLSLDPGTNPEQVNFNSFHILAGNRPFNLDILKIIPGDLDPAQESKQERILKQLFKIYNPIFHRVSGKPTHEAIKEYVELAKIDFHVLPVKKEQFLERIFGSELRKIIYATRVPLLVLHESEEK